MILFVCFLTRFHVVWHCFHSSGWVSRYPAARVLALLYWLPAPFACGLPGHLFSLPLFNLLCPKVSQIFQLLLPFLVWTIPPFSTVIVRAYWTDRKDCSALQACSFYMQVVEKQAHVPGRGVFVLWAQQAVGHQATVLFEQTCSHRSQGWFVGHGNPSLNQRPGLRASAHVLAAWITWCWNGPSVCNSATGRGKRHGQYLCGFTPNVSHHAHQNELWNSGVMLVF